VLDNPVWHALTGRHQHLTEGTGRARRYRADVSVFAAVEDWDDAAVWSDVLRLVGPDADFPFTGREVTPPDGWTLSWSGEGVQLVETPALSPTYDEEAVVLGEADVPEMLALVERTKPGPFLPSTYLLGTYLGIRDDGRLVAMAGERLKPDGWTEISAVCTDAEYRGRGLASRLVLAVAAGIWDRGEHALMHASATNANAIRLYEDLGFTLRRRTVFGSVRTPSLP
jgi:ribosomal protein S18 acetylase RimI-like enzyme